MKAIELIEKLEEIVEEDPDAEISVKTGISDKRPVYDVEYTDLRDIDGLNSTIVLN